MLIAARWAVVDDPFPKNGISMQWGRFKIAIVGPVALVTLLMIVIAIAFARDLNPLLSKLIKLGCA